MMQSSRNVRFVSDIPDRRVCETRSKVRYADRHFDNRSSAQLPLRDPGSPSVSPFLSTKRRCIYQVGWSGQRERMLINPLWVNICTRKHRNFNRKLYLNDTVTIIIRYRKGEVNLMVNIAGAACG